MHRKLSGFVLGLVAGMAWAAHDHGGSPVPAGEAPARSWTNAARLVPAGGERGERGSTRFRALGMTAEQLRLVAPDGGERLFPLGPEGARIEPVSPKTGNYHWLVAREESERHVGVASTVWYVGQPGPSPVALLARPLNELEIVPEPLPREHGSYRESEKWRFAVRFVGQPLAGQTVLLETGNGSRIAFKTDARGVATVLFPRDFPSSAGERETGGHGRTKAPFVLSTEHRDGGRHYVTAFNLNYGPDPDRQRSVGWGALFGLVGMACATPLLRRRKNAPAAGEQ